MTRLREILRDRKGNGFPLAIAITLALVIIFCGISEYIRLLIIAQGVRDAVQTAVISTVNDNYDDVYHGVREGYSGGYQPMAGDFEESLDYGDIYGRLEEVLGLSYQGGTRVKFTEDGKPSFGCGDWMWILKTHLWLAGTGPETGSLPIAKSNWRYLFPLEADCFQPCGSPWLPVPVIRRGFSSFQKVFYCPHRLLKPLVVGCALNKEVLHKRLW